MLITPTELSRKIGISKQAVFDAIANGRIPVVKEKGRRLIDTSDKSVKIYMEKERTSDPLPEKPTKPVRPSKLPGKKTAKTSAPSTFQDDDNPTDPYMIRQRAMIAEMRKKEAQAKILEKNYLPREFIEDGLFRYLERLNTTIERSASVFINEIGAKILEAGEVTPEHIEHFTGLVLEAIHNTKKRVIQEIEKYEPKI